MNDECGMHRAARVAHDRHYDGAAGNWYNDNHALGYHYPLRITTSYEMVNYD